MRGLIGGYGGLSEAGINWMDVDVMSDWGSIGWIWEV